MTTASEGHRNRGEAERRDRQEARRAEREARREANWAERHPEDRQVDAASGPPSGAERARPGRHPPGRVVSRGLVHDRIGERQPEERRPRAVSAPGSPGAGAQAGDPYRTPPRARPLRATEPMASGRVERVLPGARSSSSPVGGPRDAPAAHHCETHRRLPHGPHPRCPLEAEGHTSDLWPGSATQRAALTAFIDRCCTDPRGVACFLVAGLDPRSRAA